MNKNLNLKSSIGSSYIKKNLYSKDKLKLKKIIHNIKDSIDSKKDIFNLLSNKFDFNFKNPEIIRFNKYKTIVLIGMGGSILGAEAIYSFCKYKIKKNFIFFDNLDQLKIKEVKKTIDLKNSLFIIISKSGNTLETIVNSILFKEVINNKNTIIITEKKTNPLNVYAKDKNILLIDHKSYIGGRYSVLSEVGMIPAYFMGLKINYFRKKLLNFFNSKENKLIFENIIKVFHIYKYKKIKSIILLNYAPEIDCFLYWCQQLIAESLGKNGNGILPVISPAPKDHHSLMQLYLDGPKDKLFYIFSIKLNEKMKINKNIFGKDFNYIKNKDLSKIKEVQKNSLIKVLKKKNIPYQEFIINKKDEETLGELFSWFMIETALVGKLLGLNPFNQPAVEQVKILTKKHLS